ncbi:lysine-sensitive aspartokinase III [Escherichia coli]|uniref:Lysine-sensitive aspartokinase III n=1 Tax=Escherichia coli TaxID=562 RepID=A0A377B999_ECOLX|nr:lysine-sensitive aspartokinase III [Escherichia coli]
MIPPVQTSTGDTLLTQSLLMELSALCRVEVEEGLALVALIGNDLSKACGVGKEVFGVLEPFNISHDLLWRIQPITCASWCPAKMPSRWCKKLHF